MRAWGRNAQSFAHDEALLKPDGAEKPLTEAQLFFLATCVALYTDDIAKERARWGAGAGGTIAARGVSSERVYSAAGQRRDKRTIQALVNGGWLTGTMSGRTVTDYGVTGRASRQTFVDAMFWLVPTTKALADCGTEIPRSQNGVPTLGAREVKMLHEANKGYALLSSLSSAANAAMQKLVDRGFVTATLRPDFDTVYRVTPAGLDYLRKRHAGER